MHALSTVVSLFTSMGRGSVLTSQNPEEKNSREKKPHQIMRKKALRFFSQKLS